MADAAAAAPPVKSGPWDAHTTRLLATGKVSGVAFLSTQSGERRLRNILLAASGLSINTKDDTTKTEVVSIISRIAAGTLQSDLVSFLGQRYLVTTMRPGMFMAPHINPATPCGLVIAQLDGAIALCTFGAETLPMEAMAAVESSLYQTQAKRSRGEQ